MEKKKKRISYWSRYVGGGHRLSDPISSTVQDVSELDACEPLPGPDSILPEPQGAHVEWPLGSQPRAFLSAAGSPG